MEKRACASLLPTVLCQNPTTESSVSESFFLLNISEHDSINHTLIDHSVENLELLEQCRGCLVWESVSGLKYLSMSYGHKKILFFSIFVLCENKVKTH